jgi:hypothetical protein
MSQSALASPSGLSDPFRRGFGRVAAPPHDGYPWRADRTRCKIQRLSGFGAAPPAGQIYSGVTLAAKPSDKRAAGARRGRPRWVDPS